MSKTSVLGWLKACSLALTIIIGLLSGHVVDAAAIGGLIQAALSAVGLGQAQDALPNSDGGQARPTAGG